MSALTDAQAALYAAPNIGVLATIGPDGTPDLSPVWVDWDGEAVLVNTARGRSKERDLRRDPRATVCVFDHDDPYRWVSVAGSVEIDDDAARVWTHVDGLHRKYRGVAAGDYPRNPGEERILLRIDPERATGRVRPGVRWAEEVKAP